MRDVLGFVHRRVIPVAAAFSSDYVAGTCPPVEVQFADESTGAVSSWLWDFGDGGTSTEQNPTHTYDEVGEYTVTLIVNAGLASESVAEQDLEITCDYVDPCEAVNDNTAPTTSVDVTAEDFHAATLVFDWDEPYRIINAAAEYINFESAGIGDNTMLIEHLNLPPEGEHCAEVRFTITSNDGLFNGYSGVYVNSDPEAGNLSNPMVWLSPSHLNDDGTARVRFHVTEGVLTAEVAYP